MSNKTEINGVVVDNSIYTPPSDRTLRDAWVIDSDNIAIVVDVELAKDVWRNLIREERTALLKASDVELIKLLETSADTTALVAKRQALRDAPAHSSISSATTIAEIKAATLESILP